MKIFNILCDIQCKAYEDLVYQIGSHAAICQFVSHGEATTQTCQEALSEFVRLGATTRVVTEWPGTRLTRGKTATLYAMPVKQETLSYLASRVDSLFSWRWPYYPEDLSFLAVGGLPILISTSHERYARLMLADGMHLSNDLVHNLGVAAARKQPSGYVVNLSNFPGDEGQRRLYFGIEGDGWPVLLSDMPTINDGLASDDEFDRCEAYWYSLLNFDNCKSAKLLYLGERSPREEFRLIGYDCGYYSNGTDNLSLVLNELLLCTNPCLGKYKMLLNEYGLFAGYEDAVLFLKDVLSDSVLRNTYRGCSEDFSVFKVYCYVQS